MPKKHLSTDKKVTYTLIVSGVSFLFMTVLMLGTLLVLLTDSEDVETVAEAPILPNYDIDPTANGDACSVPVLSMQGYLVPEYSDSFYGDDFSFGGESASSILVEAIRSAKNDDTKEGLVLVVNSPGGSPVAGEEVANALKDISKPTAVLIRDRGTSAAYFAASGADRIFASRYSDVGGIGVTSSYLSYSGANEKDGLTFVDLQSVPYKDTGNPDKELSEEERLLLLQNVKLAHAYLVEDIARLRGMTIETVSRLADGSTYLGSVAVQNGLIDEVGDLESVRAYLAERVDHPVRFCRY